MQWLALLLLEVQAFAQDVDKSVTVVKLDVVQYVSIQTMLVALVLSLHSLTRIVAATRRS